MKRFYRLILVSLIIFSLNCQMFSASPKNKGPHRYLSVISDDVRITRDVAYCQPKSNALLSDNNLLDIYEPANDKEKNRMAIVLIHGGGLSEGHKNEFTEFCTELAKRGFVVFSMNHRLKANPSEDYLRAVIDGAEDVDDAITWIKENSDKYGVDKDRIAIGGGSSGGAVALEAGYGRMTKHLSSGAFAVLDLYGPVDFIKQIGVFTEESIPALIIHGVQDAVVPIDGSKELVKILDTFDIYNEFLPLENSGHGITKEYMDDAVLNISRFLYKVSNDSLSPNYKVDQDVYTVVQGESISVKLTKQTDVDVKDVNIITPSDWKVKEVKSQKSKDKDLNNLEYTIEIPQNFEKSSHLVVVESKLKDNTTNKTVFIVKVKHPLEVSLKPAYNNQTEEVEIIAEITNPSQALTQNGTITIKSAHNNQTEKLEIKSLKPMQSTTFALPQSMAGLQEIKISAKGGYKSEYQNILPVVAVPKAKTIPTIDGILDDWNDATSFDLDKPYQVELIHDWKGKNDLSAKGYMKWDNENLYLAVEVTDDIFQDSTYGGLWNGDSIILHTDPARGEGPASKGMNIYEIGLMQSGDVVTSHWLTPNGLDFEDKINDIVIKREGTKFIYEMAIPWEKALDTGRVLNIGSHLGIGMAINDNDGAINRGWIGLGTGVNYTNDPALYADMFLTK